MTDAPGSARWARVNDVFHRALDEPEAARAAFVQRECGDDRQLHDEVLSLLGAHARAADFIEQPPAATTGLFDSKSVPDAIVGQTVGHYRIARVIGRGGMGVVYLAEDTRLGRAVALKALAPSFTGDQTRRERLRREARAAAALHHSGIATVFALEEIGDQLYIAGEYVPGVTLRDEVARGPLPLRRALETARAVAAAVAVAHERGVIHRDLKPENVIRTPSGELKILDFGLARLNEPAAMLQLTADGTALGTPAYMSPEQIRGIHIDARSDVFALGVMLYEFITGVNPFKGADPASTIAHVLEAEPAPLSTAAVLGLTPAVSAALERTVQTALQKSPDLRYPTARAFIVALDDAIAVLDGAAPASAVPARPVSDALWWWQFHQIAASAAYVALFAPLIFVQRETGGDAGSLLLILGVVAALTAIVLRLHLLFAVRSYPAEFLAQRASNEPWIHRADVAFALVLVAAGLLVRAAHLSLAIVLISAAVAIVLAAVVIEPATGRAMAEKHRG